VKQTAQFFVLRHARRWARTTPIRPKLLAFLTVGVIASEFFLSVIDRNHTFWCILQQFIILLNNVYFSLSWFFNKFAFNFAGCPQTGLIELEAISLIWINCNSGDGMSAQGNDLGGVGSRCSLLFYGNTAVTQHRDSFLLKESFINSHWWRSTLWSKCGWWINNYPGNGLLVGFVDDVLVFSYSRPVHFTSLICCLHQGSCLKLLILDFNSLFSLLVKWPLPDQWVLLGTWLYISITAYFNLNSLYVHNG